MTPDSCFSHPIVVTTVAALQNGGTQQTPPAYGSRVTIHDLADASSRVMYEADTVWEAPNWSQGRQVSAVELRRQALSHSG